MPHMVVTTTDHREWRLREVDSNPPNVCTLVAPAVLFAFLSNIDYEICRWKDVDVYCRRTPGNPRTRQVFAYSYTGLPPSATHAYVVPAHAAEVVNISMKLDPHGRLHVSPDMLPSAGPT